MRHLRSISVTLGACILGAHLALAIAACSGCGGNVPLPTTPRERARAVVLVLTEGTREADHQCAQQGRASGNLELLDNCARAYSAARSSLLVAAGAVDAYDSAHQAETACATQDGIAAAEELAGLVRFAGGGVPPALVDALSLASQVSLPCVRTAQKDAS